MADRVFLREVRLEKLGKTLLFYQSSVGNVSVVVWDAALVLTKYIERRENLARTPWLKKLKIVELGAGLGCVGITAACYGAEVILTDLPDVIPQIVKTIELNKMAWTGNGGHVKPLAYKWDQTPYFDLIESFGGKYPDVILLSDCVYYPEAVEPLLRELVSLSDGNTEILLSQEIRDLPNHQEIWKKFLVKFEENFNVKQIKPSEQDEQFTSYDIHLYSATKKVPPKKK